MNRFKAPGSLAVSCRYEAESVYAGGKPLKDLGCHSGAVKIGVVALKYSISLPPCRIGVHKPHVYPDGRLSGLPAKLVSAYCAKCTWYGRAIVIRTLTSSL